MKSSLLSGAAFLFAVCISSAQPKATTAGPPPFSFLGKSFEECEKTVGKPVNVTDPKGDEKAFTRDYKPPGSKALTRLQLFRGPDGAADRPVSPTVNGVTYYFPKGSVKTWQDAFGLLGLKTDGAKEEKVGSDGILRVQAPEFPQGWIIVQWTPSGSTMKMPEQYRRPNEDTLSFMGKFPPVAPPVR